VTWIGAIRHNRLDVAVAYATNPVKTAYEPKNEQASMAANIAYALNSEKGSAVFIRRSWGVTILPSGVLGWRISLPNGRPCDIKIIDIAFAKLIKRHNLPSVVFHSLRHSSTTYKLKLNNGACK